MSVSDLICRLESGDIEVRREAARTLAELPAMGAIMERDERDISAAISPLAAAFLDGDDELRTYAAQALAGAQRDAQDISAALPVLVASLSDERADVRRSASLILRDAVVKGLDATPFELQLDSRLQDATLEVKWAAADALTYHLASRQRWDELADLLGHPDPDVAQETAGTLAEFWFRFDYRPVMPALVALLTADHPELRLVAAKAVVVRPQSVEDLVAAVPVLLEALDSAEHRIQIAALRSAKDATRTFLNLQPQLQRELDPEALAPITPLLPHVLRLLSAEKAALQVAAIEFVQVFLEGLPVSAHPGYREMIELVERQLYSAPPAIAKAAAQCLTIQWVRSQRWGALLKVLARAESAVKRAVLNTLAWDDAVQEFDFAPLAPAVLGILVGPESGLHYVAQNALGRLEPNRLLEQLESEPLNTEAQRELIEEVRAKIHSQRLTELKRELENTTGADAIDYLMKHLRDPERAVCCWAAERLWWIAQTQDTSAAIPGLTRLLDDPDPVARCAGATALGDTARHGSIQEAHLSLAQLVQDHSSRVRALAFRALWMSAEQGGDLTAVLPTLCDVLHTAPSPEDRSEAGHVLGQAAQAGCSLQPAVTALVSALSDDHERVRFYAARAFYYAAQGGAEIREAIPALARTLLDQHKPAADWAVAALEYYAANALQARETLDALRSLDSDHKRVKKVLKACQNRLGSS